MSDLRAYLFVASLSILLNLQPLATVLAELSGEGRTLGEC
jgi:hypothetical protein